MARPSSFRPLKRLAAPTAPRPEGATSIYLEREDGTGFYVTHAVTDANDGITDADFEFVDEDVADEEWADILAEMRADGVDDFDEGRVLAARDLTGNNFERYWTRGKGLARWRFHLHPWRRLRALLRKHKRIRDPEGLASTYFRKAFGYWPGHRKGSNPVGPG